MGGSRVTCIDAERMGAIRSSLPILATLWWTLTSALISFDCSSVWRKWSSCSPENLLSASVSDASNFDNTEGKTTNTQKMGWDKHYDVIFNIGGWLDAVKWDANILCGGRWETCLHTENSQTWIELNIFRGHYHRCHAFIQQKLPIRGVTLSSDFSFLVVFFCLEFHFKFIIVWFCYFCCFLVP